MKWTDKILVQNVLPFIPKGIEPNHLTFLRIILSPVVGWFLYTEQFLWGGLLFAVLAITDSIDGAMARSQNKISRWGKIYDPLADKLLIGIAVFILVTKYISAWLAWAIIVIETILLVQGGYRSYRLNQDIQANVWGKTKMIFQSVGVMFIIMGVALETMVLMVTAEYILYAALASGIISLSKYNSTI